jgi:hypothetical protein
MEAFWKHLAVLDAAAVRFRLPATALSAAGFGGPDLHPAARVTCVHRGSDQRPPAEARASVGDVLASSGHRFAAASGRP